MALRAVIFDFDGVLVDDEQLHYTLFRDLLVPYGIDLDYETYRVRYMAYTDREALEHIFRDHGKARDAGEIEALCREKQRRFRSAVGELPPIPGVEEIIEEAARTCVLAIASGSTRDEILTFLQQHRMGDYFDVIIAADDVRAGKPDPEPYLQALARLRSFVPGLRADACLAIEDSPGGIQAARAAGMKTVALTTSLPAAALGEADLIVEGDFRSFPWREVHALFSTPSLFNEVRPEVG